MPLLNFIEIYQQKIPRGNNQDRVALNLLEPSERETEYSQGTSTKETDANQSAGHNCNGRRITQFRVGFNC